MKLTKKKALEICKRLWTWVAKEELVNVNAACKGNWPEWERNGGKIPDMQNNCPCCEYADVDGLSQGANCKNCPLSSLWGKNPFACQYNLASPYRKWYRSIEFKLFATGRSEMAKQIVNACDRELKKLNKKKS